MNNYSRAFILTTLRPDPAWSGFDDFIYNKIECSLLDCVEKIHICWKWSSWGLNRPTFINIARMLKSKCLDYPDIQKEQKIQYFVNNFSETVIRVPTFLHRDLKKRWAVEYPSNINIPDEAYIAEDLNHRLTAYSLKYLECPQIGNYPAVIYLGHL